MVRSLNTSFPLAKQTLKMDKTQINAKAKKAEEEWERLQESRKIKKIPEDATAENTPASVNNAPKETDVIQEAAKEKTKKDNLRDIA